MNLAVFVRGQYLKTEPLLPQIRLYWERRRMLRPDLHITLVEIPAR